MGLADAGDDIYLHLRTGKRQPRYLDEGAGRPCVPEIVLADGIYFRAVIDVGQVDRHLQASGKAAACRLEDGREVLEYLPGLSGGIVSAEEFAADVGGAASRDVHHVAPDHGVGVVADWFVRPFDEDFSPALT